VSSRNSALTLASPTRPRARSKTNKGAKKISETHPCGQVKGKKMRVSNFGKKGIGVKLETPIKYFHQGKRFTGLSTSKSIAQVQSLVSAVKKRKKENWEGNMGRISLCPGERDSSCLLIDFALFTELRV
jgi:hypothetical protein